MEKRSKNFNVAGPATKILVIKLIYTEGINSDDILRFNKRYRTTQERIKIARQIIILCRYSRIRPEEIHYPMLLVIAATALQLSLVLVELKISLERLKYSKETAVTGSRGEGRGENPRGKTGRTLKSNYRSARRTKDDREISGNGSREAYS